MFGITSAETAVLALYFAGIASALTGRWARLLSAREALLVLVVALLLPVVGSVVSITMVAMAWYQRRRTVPAPPV